MKDFAKSIVCNTKAEAEKVGNSYQYAGSIPIEKIPDNWRPEFPKAGYIVYYAPNKAKWFATEAEAKRFAESQDKAQKTGNSRVWNKKIKGSYVTIDTSTGRVTFDDFAGKSFDISRIDSSAGYELRVMQQQINDFKKALDEAKSLAKQIGNSKVGNGITKFGLGKYVIADGHKAIVLGEKEERGPNGIPFGWVTIRWVEGPWKGQSDQYYDYDLKKTGNTKVGNYGPDQAEAREFQQALRPIKSLIEEAGTAIYASSKEAISDLQKAKQEIDRAISWAKNL